MSKLPQGKVVPMIEPDWFPTRWQAVAWRNAAAFPPEKMASLLHCPVDEYRKALAAMGLEKVEVQPCWMRQGYLTIIRDNWNLLNNNQLLELLEWPEDKLYRVLFEEDFLWHKLGCCKPELPDLYWRPLTSDEERRTAKLRTFIQREWLNPVEPPFAFGEPGYFASLPACEAGKTAEEFNFIHAYCGNCGDLFAPDAPDSLSEELLRRYASCGVKGLWTHALLRHFCPIPGAEEYSLGHEARLAKLRAIARRCRDCGLGLYLYLNEPRGMPPDFYEKHPDWRGTPGCCCTSNPAVLQWTRDAAQKLFASVPELAGTFLINMSENLTNCDSKGHKDQCPRCRERDSADLIAECVQALRDGVRAGNPQAEIVVFDWSWNVWKPGGGLGTDNLEFKKRVVGKLPQDVTLMCVSEWEKHFQQNGKDRVVRDYSISKVGPSDESRAVWQAARARGMKIAAKVQLNNTWELCTVPYLPVPYLVREHIDNLRALEVDGLMLSWTLGGYPGGNLELLSRSPEEIAQRDFPECADAVCRVWKCFSEAFREFPFSIIVAYFCPVNSGPAAPFFLKPTGRRATMVVGYPWDDMVLWRDCFSEEELETQFVKLCDKWETGMKLLASLPDTPAVRELRTVATAANCHFRSCRNHILFVRRREKENPASELLPVIADEIDLVQTLLPIVCHDARIGFEAANHYVYTPLSLAEKLLNCRTLTDQLKQMETK